MRLFFTPYEQIWGIEREGDSGMGVLWGFSRNCPSERGIAFAAGSLGVWELRRETAGGRMRPASDTARRDVSPLLGEAGMLQGQTWLPQ